MKQSTRNLITRTITTSYVVNLFEAESFQSSKPVFLQAVESPVFPLEEEALKNLEAKLGKKIKAVLAKENQEKFGCTIEEFLSVAKKIEKKQDEE